MGKKKLKQIAYNVANKHTWRNLRHLNRMQNADLRHWVYLLLAFRFLAMWYISKNKRLEIKEKFNGLCAYSGTPLEDDWQIDHVKPLIRNWVDGTSMFPDAHCDENLIPCQKIINHYKGSLDLETFRNWFLGGLHERMDKPKNPMTEKSKRKKEYLNKVASYFGITPTKPFDGTFYFERVGK